MISTTYRTLENRVLDFFGKPKKTFNRPVCSYEEALAQVKTITDGLGHPVDEKIQSLVAALRMWGVSTTGSCAGHSEYVFSFPWIDVEYNDLAAVCHLIGSQNRPTRDDGTANKNIWVIQPSCEARIVPWDISKPLEHLQQGAEDFSQRLRQRATWKW